MGQAFSLVINLDKSAPEAALAKRIAAKEKWGFLLSDGGKIVPANQNAFAKWDTGINDLSMIVNRKHFVEEIFEICGFQFGGETYWMPRSSKGPGQIRSSKRLIGLNTGCGVRWLTRLWPEKSFLLLADLLQRAGHEVVFLGGSMEDSKNQRLAIQSGGRYKGVLELTEFADLIDDCDVVVTSVTMALHMALAKEKRVVLLNNIFPSNEFHLYGRGEILEPGLTCQACYKNRFDENCVSPSCMSLITVEDVFTAVERQISLLDSRQPVNAKVRPEAIPLSEI